MRVMTLRLLLKRRGIVRVDVTAEGLLFSFSPDTDVKPESMIRLAASQPKRFQFLSERKMKVKVPNLPPLEGLAQAKRMIAEWH